MLEVNSDLSQCSTPTCYSKMHTTQSSVYNFTKYPHPCYACKPLETGDSQVTPAA